MFVSNNRETCLNSDVCLSYNRYIQLRKPITNEASDNQLN
jgi:hypothetical protein